ncbi:peptidoglycan-binding protein [Streptomyces sp. NPDC059690]|uniref:peptidoglycan-binding protein n=1 Tax=Streptomyces sp. NPDC059690 TaxID=3346907 RepID=UPI0036C5012A
MSRWKALPAELDPRVRQLVVRLRRLKDHGGLSMRQLAARTRYSAKSWERYLGGRTLPPPEAVEAIARIAGDDPTRLLALREVAAEAWKDGRAAPDPDAGTPDVLSAGAEGRAAGGRSLRVALTAGAVALLLAVCAAILVTVRLSDDHDRTARTSASLSPSAAPAPSSPTYGCQVVRVDGRWYGGNSRTTDTQLARGNAGPAVAEAQCLLRRAGLSPGPVDGIFGPRTENAVRHLQRRAGLVVDGIIGPHTWKALRE